MATWRPSGKSWKEKFSQGCRNGDLERVEELLSTMDDSEDDGGYALWTASGYGMQKLILSILNLGVNVNSHCEQDGMAALHRAAKNGHLEAAGVLIGGSANVNAATLDGSTPLHLASRGGHIPVIKKLICCGADVNAQTIDGSTALHFASHNGHHKVVRILVDADADVAIGTKDMTTPLHCAAILGSLDIAIILFEAGASPCVADQEGLTPLHIAAKHGHSGLLELLVSAGANLWELTKDNETVLHLCAETGNSAAASVLIHASKERGVKAKVSNRWSVANLETACAAGARAGAHAAGSSGNRASAGVATAAAADATACGGLRAATPTTAATVDAAMKPALEELDYLHLKNKDGKTALHLAVLKKCYNLAQDLMCAGVDPKITDENQCTPLHYAAQHEFLEIIRLLLDHGANLNAKNSDGQTARDLAVQVQGRHGRAVAILENAAMVMQLLQYGTCDCEDVTIAIGGAPGAGKTTFVDSYGVTRVEGIFRYENSRDRGATDPATRTRGIRLVAVKDTSGRVHTKHFMDFGGHEDFIPAHSLFLSESSTPSLAILLLDGSKDESDMAQQLEQWCGVFISCNRELPRREKQTGPCGAEAFAMMPDRRMPMIVIVSRGTSLDGGKRQRIWDLYQSVCGKFRMYLDFEQEPIFLDCRKSYSEKMVALRARINAISNRLMKQAGQQPRLIQAIRKALPRVRKHVGKPFCYRPAFTAALLDALKADGKATNSIDFSGSSARQAIEPALRLLSCYGELVTFESPTLKDTIVIEPEWLLTTIVGQLCSPKFFFPQLRVTFEKGRAAKEDVVQRLTAPHQPGAMVLDMLMQLGLCVVEQNNVIVPSKLPPLDSDHTQIGNWQARTTPLKYAGVRFSCEESIPLSAGFVVLLQTRTFSEFQQQQGKISRLWLRGVGVSPCASEVQGTIGVHPTRLAVDVAVRGPAGSQRDMFALLHILCELVVSSATQYSPGTVLCKLVLSAAELQDKVETPTLAYPGVTYLPSDVENAIRGNRIVESTDSEVSDRALDLLHLPPTHIHLISACSLEKLCEVLDTPSDRDWKHLAERLGFTCAEISTSIGQTPGSKTAALLQRWARKSPNNCVERLLRVQEHPSKGNIPAAKILREELQKPFLGTPNLFVARKMGCRDLWISHHGVSFTLDSEDQ
eukprot:scpid25118/ scgid20228/ Ankyrin-3; Ankyrin-G